ncbi:hypothetical protein BsWGS_25974 [Bradybaena similaris]
MMYKYAVLVICAVVSVGNCADTEERRGFVGFSASLDEAKSFTPGQTVKYQNVITNAGNHYNPDTGVFTAPRTAYYLFNIHALSHGATPFWFQLIHNETPRASLHGNTPNAWSMGGNSVLLKVKAGERVYVKAIYLPSHVYGDGLQHYTTFTGHLAGV